MSEWVSERTTCSYSRVGEWSLSTFLGLFLLTCVIAMLIRPQRRNFQIQHDDFVLMASFRLEIRTKALVRSLSSSIAIITNPNWPSRLIETRAISKLYAFHKPRFLNRPRVSQSSLGVIIPSRFEVAKCRDRPSGLELATNWLAWEIGSEPISCSGRGERAKVIS